jgi:hypothetical protein
MISAATFNYVQELLSEMKEYDEAFDCNADVTPAVREQLKMLDTNWNKAYEQIPDGLLRHDFQD